MIFERVYHPYYLWEETTYNMWGESKQLKTDLAAAIEFTSDHKKYGAAMMRVIKEWPISCENALTDRYLNRKAWIGHAACALILRCPEDVVRNAWGKLSNEQRLLANIEASRAIRAWEHSYAKSKKLHDNMGSSLL